MFKIKPNRTYKITGKIKDEEFYIIYKFKVKEDFTYEDIIAVREKLSEEEFNELVEEAAKKPEEMTFKNSQKRLVDLSIRRSIIDFSDNFVDEETLQKLKLFKEDGSIDEDVQKVIFDIAVRDNQHYDNALTSYIGPLGKNSKSGVTQQQSGDGVPPDVESVKTTENFV